MNLILFLLFQLIYSQSKSEKYIKEFSYSYLSTQFLEQYTKNIAVLKAKNNNMTKCFAIKNINKNDTIFEYRNEEIISTQNIDIENKENMALIINKYVNDSFLQDRLLLSSLIYFIMKNPYNIQYINRKLRLFILNLPFEEVNPIEYLNDKNFINEKILKKDWLIYDIKSEKELVNPIINDIFNINITNQTDENYILFFKIYYYIKINSFNLNGKAAILPFMDTCNIVPYYLIKKKLNYDSIYIEEIDNKIFVKSKIDILQSDQFVFSFDIPLTNDYLLLKQGKSIYNNMNDKIIINKKFEIDNHLNNSIIKFNNINYQKFEIDEKSKTFIFSYELYPNKISESIYNFGTIYFNENIQKTFFFLIKMCYDELKEIYRIINNRYKLNFKDYLIKIQEEKNISETNAAINEFNLAKIFILEKNINLAYKKLLFLNFKEIQDIKLDYI